MLDQDPWVLSKYLKCGIHHIIIYFSRFDDLNVLVPNGDPLNLTFSVWDLGQDIAATSDVLKNQTWECELTFTINVPVVIVGETAHIISSPGSGDGVFAITKFDGSGTNIQFMATCTSPDTGR